MINVLLIVHIIVAAALIGVVLVQKNEGGGLGIGGGGGGMSGVMTGRGAANLLTRVTKYLAGMFMALSLALTIMMNQRQESGSLVDQLRDTGTPGVSGEGTTPAPAPTPGEPAPKVE